jgi:hypothetical protein
MIRHQDAQDVLSTAARPNHQLAYIVAAPAPLSAHAVARGGSQSGHGATPLPRLGADTLLMGALLAAAIVALLTLTKVRRRAARLRRAHDHCANSPAGSEIRFPAANNPG